jgi:hypothetical protein
MLTAQWLPTIGTHDFSDSVQNQVSFSPDREPISELFPISKIGQISEATKI